MMINMFDEMLNAAIETDGRRPVEKRLSTVKSAICAADDLLADSGYNNGTTLPSVRILNNGSVVLQLDEITIQTTKPGILHRIMVDADRVDFEAVDDHHIRMTVVFPSIF